MTETVTVKIGGEDIALPLILNLATLERSWPALIAWSEATDPIAKSSSGLAFLAAVLAKDRPDLTLPTLKDRLRVARFLPDTDDTPVEYDERDHLNRVVRELAVASGLVPRKPPESPAAAGKSPSGETGSTSSPN